MDSKQPTTADTDFRDRAILLFAGECLKQLGVKSAPGCESLAVDFADRLLAKRNEVKQP